MPQTLDQYWSTLVSLPKRTSVTSRHMNVWLKRLWEKNTSHYVVKSSQFIFSFRPIHPIGAKSRSHSKWFFLLQDHKMIKKKILFFSSSQKRSKSSCFLLFLPSQVLDFFAASRPTNVLLGTAMMDKPSFLDHKKAGKYQGWWKNISFEWIRLMRLSGVKFLS